MGLLVARSMLVLFFVVSVAGAQVFSCPGPFSRPPLPSFPVEDDPTIPQPSQGEVVTRATNSEVVDLGHPGPFLSGGSSSSECPYDEADLEHWSDLFGFDASGDVELPEGKKVLLSACSVVSRSLDIVTIPSSSELIFADEPIHLSVSGMDVRGKLRIGSETCRIRSEASVTLRGERPLKTTPVPAPQVKGIFVTGSLDIHAVEFYHTWSRLAATATPGDRYILLQDVVNWDAGSTIVLTTTQLKDARDWHQNEIFTVVDVKRASHLSHGVTAVYLNDTVKFTHYGRKEYQAEVGLLTRRFKIQGEDTSSEPTDTEPLACSSSQYASFPCPESYLTGYGGHVMITGVDAKARVSGVEFYRMGQTNFEGRYPIHWHLAYDGGEGSYVRDSSFYRSFYKCVTIHGTNGVLVTRNVAFDVIGHCLYLEDGVEEFNNISYNLHAHVHPIGMPPGEGRSSQYLPDVLSGPDLATASDATASGFYISNAYNYVIGNAAVGGYSGFQFPIFPSAIGLHRSSPTSPRSGRTLKFDGNSCRSSGHWWGHAGCVYLGGLFSHTDDESSDDPNETPRMVYNAGRTINGLRPCQRPLSPDGWCSKWERDDCDGTYPTACYAYLELSNLKVALTNVGVMNWGRRGRLSKFEAHDLNGGPAAEVFGDNSITDLLVTCETDNEQFRFCDPTSPHNGGGQGQEPLDSRGCSSFDDRFWESRRKVVQWYDTGMNTVVTNATFRNCDPETWRECSSDCAKSSIFESVTHSNQFLPELLSITAGIRYEDDHDDQGSKKDVKKHLIYFSSPNTQTMSGRTVGWLDLDGGVCDSGKEVPTILGSNHDAGDWWRLDDDDDCEVAGVNSELYCCPARERLIASLYFEWDAELQAQLKGNGGSLCENGSTESHSDCPRVGFIARFGQTDLQREGLKLDARPELVGPVPTFEAADGFGWFLALDRGAPVELRLRRLQIHHRAVFVMALAYPKGTSFALSTSNDDPNRYGCGSLYLCEIDYARTYDTQRLVSQTGAPTYYVDEGQNASYDVLYFRVFQRDERRLSDDVDWDSDWTAPMFTNDYLDARPGDWGLPYRFDGPVVTVKADCPADGAYCAGGFVDAGVPPLLWRAAVAEPSPTFSSTTSKPTPAPTTTTSKTTHPMTTTTPTAVPTAKPVPRPPPTTKPPTVAPVPTTPPPPLVPPTRSPSAVGSPLPTSTTPSSTPTTTTTTTSAGRAPSFATSSASSSSSSSQRQEPLVSALYFTLSMAGLGLAIPSFLLAWFCCVKRRPASITNQGVVPAGATNKKIKGSSDDD